MKFAHFSHIWTKPGYTAHRRYEELWAELQLCDELGFDYGFCVEHHFRPDESWISSPSLYAVGAGSRTKRLRVGPMGYIVPLYHPLRLAEEIAIVDQMLGGRMECGLVPATTEDNERASILFPVRVITRSPLVFLRPIRFHSRDRSRH